MPRIGVTTHIYKCICFMYFYYTRIVISNIKFWDKILTLFYYIILLTFIPNTFWLRHRHILCWSSIIWLFMDTFTILSTLSLLWKYIEGTLNLLSRLFYGYLSATHMLSLFVQHFLIQLRMTILQRTSGDYCI